MQVPANDVLIRHFPDAAVVPVMLILKKNRIRLIFSRDRKSKLGDFKPRSKELPHRISVNGSLNPYAALLVFLHEYAHLAVHEQYGRSHPPHGKAWKEQFGRLIRQSINEQLFPDAIKKQLLTYSFKVRASGLADPTLTRMLRQYDKNAALHNWLFLDELPDGKQFQARNGWLFVKGKKLRSRYRCQCLHNKRPYLISAMTMVKPFIENLQPQAATTAFI